MKTSIVIPNWNGVGKIEKNLTAVLKVKGVDEVIVVDDASGDRSVEVIKKEFLPAGRQGPQIKLFEQKKNKGFAATVNFGVNKASGELIFLLNNDAKPGEDSLIKVLDHFKEKKVFSVGCNTGGNWSWARFEDGFFWHFQAPASQVFDLFEPERPQSRRPEGSDRRGQALRAHQTLWVSGGSGVFRKSVWDDLGGFDGLYKPFYEEDVDLGYRATKRGYVNLWEPSSVVEHYTEPGVISQYHSKAEISQVAQRNQLLFIWKNITSKNLIQEHKKALIKMLITHPKYWSIFLSALISLPEILKKRDVEKKQAKLTDEEILRRFEYN